MIYTVLSHESPVNGSLQRRQIWAKLPETRTDGARLRFQRPVARAARTRDRFDEFESRPFGRRALRQSLSDKISRVARHSNVRSIDPVFRHDARVPATRRSSPKPAARARPEPSLSPGIAIFGRGQNSSRSKASRNGCMSICAAFSSNDGISRFLGFTQIGQRNVPVPTVDRAAFDIARHRIDDIAQLIALACIRPKRKKTLASPSFPNALPNPLQSMSNRRFANQTPDRR